MDTELNQKIREIRQKGDPLTIKNILGHAKGLVNKPSARRIKIASNVVKYVKEYVESKGDELLCAFVIGSVATGKARETGYYNLLPNPFIEYNEKCTHVKQIITDHKEIKELLELGIVKQKPGFGPSARPKDFPSYYPYFLSIPIKVGDALYCLEKGFKKNGETKEEPTLYWFHGARKTYTMKYMVTPSHKKYYFLEDVDPSKFVGKFIVNVWIEKRPTDIDMFFITKKGLYPPIRT